MGICGLSCVRLFGKDELLVKGGKDWLRLGLDGEMCGEK